jgi:putative salt-induced outer membrane protein YdiY
LLLKKNLPDKSTFFYLIFLSITFLFLFPCQAFAQINIETLRKTDQDEGFHLDIKTDVGILAGNSNARQLSGSIRPDYCKDVYHLFLIAEGSRGDADNNLYKNKGFVHVRGQRSITELVAFEAFSQEEFNDFINLEERTLYGAGTRISPFTSLADEKKDSDFTLHLGVGLMWETERYKDDDDTYLLRSTNYLSGKWEIHERLLFSATTYYQVDTNYAADFRIIVDGSFVVDITEKLKLTLSVNYRFDNKPPQDIKNFDIEITNGLAVFF